MLILLLLLLFALHPTLAGCWLHAPSFFLVYYLIMIMMLLFFTFLDAIAQRGLKPKPTSPSLRLCRVYIYGEENYRAVFNIYWLNESYMFHIWLGNHCLFSFLLHLHVHLIIPCGRGHSTVTFGFIYI
jgi:hypothetical protein